jgi:hypothetical protein
VHSPAAIAARARLVVVELIGGVVEIGLRRFGEGVPGGG